VVEDDNFVMGSNGQVFEVLLDELSCRVWINGQDGSCLARFNPNKGIDLHNSVTEQMQGAPECRFCTHEKAYLPDWELFMSKVDEYWGITICAEINERLLAFYKPEMGF